MSQFTSANDISFIRVSVQLDLNDKNQKLYSSGDLRHKLPLKDLVAHYNSDFLDDTEDEFFNFNPSNFPESFIKFRYLIEDELHENEENDLLLYRDLEPWRNVFVKLHIVDDISMSGTTSSIDDNVYCKTIDLKQLSDINTYYDIALNTFKILKQYYKTLKYLKLKSPTDIIVESDEKDIKLDFENIASENSNTYYQLSKAKYKIKNTDLDIQMKSRQMKYKANLLILAGQYQASLTYLNDCIIQFYKNGDFLWLANALEMIIFVILNLIAIPDSNNTISVPHCIDYLIDYDKHAICKDKILKKHDILRVTNDQTKISSDTPRNSSDLQNLHSHSSELVDGNSHSYSRRHEIFPQALPLLIANIYEKLIHYYEYTANETIDFVTPILLNQTIINYLNFLHLSITVSDFNIWLEKLTTIETSLYERCYLQPIENDLLFQLMKFERLNLIKTLPLHQALRWIKMQIIISRVLQTKKNVVLVLFNWISDNKERYNFNLIKIWNEPLTDYLFQLLIENIENKIIAKKIFLLLLNIATDLNLRIKICNLGLQNYNLFNATELLLIFNGIKSWPSSNKSLITSINVIERDAKNPPLPNVQYLKTNENEMVEDEVFNPFRNKDYSRKKKIPVAEYVYIKNETINLELHFFNYYSIDLKVENIKASSNLSNIFKVFEFVPVVLAAKHSTTVYLNLLCIDDFVDGSKEIDEFIIQLSEVRNAEFAMHIQNKKSIILFSVLPEQPLLTNTSIFKTNVNYDSLNDCSHILQNMNAIKFDIFDIEVNTNKTCMNPLAFFNKKRISKAESQLYDYMKNQIIKSIYATFSVIGNGDIKLNVTADFANFKVPFVDKIDFVMKYGIIRNNIKYMSSLAVPWVIDYVENMIITNLEIIPFISIPSEQISLGVSTKNDQIENKESWLNFAEENYDFKWLLLLNVRNISNESISLYFKYADSFQSESFNIESERNKRIIIPIEASLFENDKKNGQTTAFNILMNFNNIIHIMYSKVSEEIKHKMNLLTNIKLEDCYNSQKLVNRQDVEIFLSNNESILSTGQKASIVLKPGLNTLETHHKNVLVSLMVIDTITGKDVLEDDRNTILLNGMRTFNIDSNQDSVTIDCIFLIPGNYEINCLCEIGDDPSRVVKFFSTRPCTLRVIH
ncbi:hypothetical protein QEN19_002150 [Hanseniaspora menglaensis]